MIPTQSIPILWADLINECCEQQDTAGVEVMLQAYEAGLHDGITFPWHGANGHVGLLSFITSTSRPEHQWLTATPFLSWLSVHIVEAAARVCLSDIPPREALSLRELEVCQWAAAGKRKGVVEDLAQALPTDIYRYLRFEYLHHSADSGLVNYPNQIDGREARRIINNLKGGK